MIAFPSAIQQGSLVERATLEFIRQCRAPKLLGHVEFAEKYVRLPSGDFINERWRADRLPWTRVLFDELDKPHWLKVATTGPTQSGKTQQCFTIPTLRQAHQVPQHNIVLGVPDDDMGDKKFRTDILPIIDSSPALRRLRPKGGAGSKGGKVKDTVTFGNGCVAAIMSKGASDEGKAGFSAPWGAVTEAAGLSEGRTTSEETDPLGQIMGRLLGFPREKRRLLVEGTVKIETMLPWSLRGKDDGPLISSQSRLISPCPHCGEFICPEREHFVGWEEAETDDIAGDESTFICPSCGVCLSEDDRKESNRDLRLVHRGQTIDKKGEVHGDRPRTSTLWFRYTQWHNLLTSYGDLAAEEWTASKQPEGTQRRDNLDRALFQQRWNLPYRSVLVDNEPLEAEVVAKRFVELPRNELPPTTEKVTIGVDIGKKKGWYLVFAWLVTGERHVVAYGDFEIMPSGEGNLHGHIVSALKGFIKPLVETGFVMEGAANRRLPDTVWIDGGYHPDAVAEFVRGQGRVAKNRYRFCRGRGMSAAHKWLRGVFYNRKKKSSAVPLVGNDWFAEINPERRCLEYTFNADTGSSTFTTDCEATGRARGR